MFRDGARQPTLDIPQFQDISCKTIAPQMLLLSTMYVNRLIEKEIVLTPPDDREFWPRQPNILGFRRRL
jgi:hypothetical protein